MANKKLFFSARGPIADATNLAGGKAYAYTCEHALAQYAVTGFLADSFYNSGYRELETILDAVKLVDSDFLAKTAIYAREVAFMKDTPALLLATLVGKVDKETFSKVFARVVDNGKMLRNLVQIIRSGQVGRRSFGTRLKREIKHWLETRSPVGLFYDSVGNNPSIADIIKLVHPKPSTLEMDAIFAYILGNITEEKEEYLPQIVKDYEAWKKDTTLPVPTVPFDKLLGVSSSTETWSHIAKNAKWTMTRMNLNNFEKHGVLDDSELRKIIIDRLSDPEQIRSAKVFPYQLFAAYLAYSGERADVKEALQQALDISVENVPSTDSKVLVCVDISGSMNSPVTGYRGSATSSVMFIHVASLILASFIKKNPKSGYKLFNSDVVKISLNPRDSMVTIAEKIADTCDGGTRISASLQEANEEKADYDLVIVVSDNESWIETYDNGSVDTMCEWDKYKKRVPHAKLVCIDLDRSGTSQVVSGKDVLNIGGFSDSIWSTIIQFIEGKSIDAWVKEIRAVAL